MPTPSPGAEKTSKKNKNYKNFKFEKTLTCMYLTQASIRENLKI
jgi:hypothetical protein